LNGLDRFVKYQTAVIGRFHGVKSSYLVAMWAQKYLVEFSTARHSPYPFCTLCLSHGRQHPERHPFLDRSIFEDRTLGDVAERIDIVTGPLLGYKYAESDADLLPSDEDYDFVFCPRGGATSAALRHIPRWVQ
jgi:hypothetical protein